MSQEEFQEICERVKKGETICVEHSDRQQGKVLGCLQGGESFRVEVKNTGTLEVWHRTDVAKKAEC